MDTNSITGLGTTYEPPKSDLKLGSDAVSRDDFLTLLVAQLQHQDPLNPLENQEFVSELATFSSLEQQTNQTELLEQLIATQQGNMNSQALSIIGQDVAASVDSFGYNSGDRPTFLVKGPPGGEVTVKITSQAGTVVRSDTVQMPTSGVLDYQFDGLTEYGTELAPGTYRISAGSGINTEGETLKQPVFLTGQVNEVRFEDGTPILSVGGQSVGLDQVLSVRHRNPFEGAI